MRLSLLGAGIRYCQQHAVPHADGTVRPGRPSDDHYQEASAAPHLPAWHGRHAGAPAARLDGAGPPAQAPATRPVRRFAPSTCLTASCCRSGRRPRRARAIEMTPILKPLAAFRDQMVVISGTSAGPTVLNGGHAVAPASYLTGNVQPKQTEGSDILNRHHGGPGDRQGHRPGHAVPVARDRDRGLQDLDRRVRHRLQLHLHEHDLLGGTDLAAPDGDQPARGVRAHVRRRGHARSAPGTRCRQNRSILDSIVPTSRALPERPRTARPGVGSPTTSTHVREIERRIQKAEAPDGDAADRPDRTDRPAGGLRRSRGACCST